MSEMDQQPQQTDVVNEPATPEVTPDTSNVIQNPKVIAGKPAIVRDDSPKEDRDCPAILPRSFESLDEELKNSRIFNVQYGEAGSNWADAIRRGIPNMPSKIPLEEQFQNSEGVWRPYVEHNANRLGAAKLKIGSFGQAGGTISGERAVQRVRSLLGGGEELYFPLFASGIWVSLRPATDLEQDRLDTLILITKERLGRQTSGLSFSNSVVYIVEHLYNFIVSHITSSNVVDNDLDVISECILLSDLQNLAWAMAAAIYTNGYPLDVPCVNNLSECQHVGHYKLNVMYMIWHNSDRLTPKQRAYMLERDKKRTKKEILDYQSENGTAPACKISTTVEISPRVKVVLGQPTIREHIIDGHFWIDSIIGHINGIFPSPDDGDDADPTYDRRRNSAILKQANLSPLRVYGHYIREIIIVEDDDTTRRIVDREPLLDVLNTICMMDGMAEKVIDGIRRYIAATTISVVGVPRQPCPQCQTTVVADDEHPDLIALDAVSLFFSLLRSKLRKRQSTSLDMI